MEEPQLLRVARAIADPTRFGIFKKIAESGEICCGALAAAFPVKQATVSHHVKILEEAGLVETRREGQHHYFRVVPATLEDYRASLGRLL